MIGEVIFLIICVIAHTFVFRFAGDTLISFVSPSISSVVNLFLVQRIAKKKTMQYQLRFY